MKSVLFRLLAVLLAVAACVAGALAWYAHRPLRLAASPLDFTIEPGSSMRQVARQLVEAGIDVQPAVLVALARITRQAHAIKAGSYEVEAGLTPLALLAKLTRGDVSQAELAIIEGWNFRQLRAALRAQERLEQTLAEVDDATLMERLGRPGEHPEGRFFPDTYHYVRGMRDIDLLRQAHERLGQVLDEEWARRAEGLPYRDAYQALVMASLVEKETGVPDERAEIAGVFIRRLRLGMLLQTDPTVIYGLGERFAGKLTRAHLREPTPYNTYTNPGLPPTPIAMVGREAIRAALNPADGDTLYFVARGDGSHAFSRTLDEHNRAVREYQLKRRADYRSSPPPSQEKTP